MTFPSAPFQTRSGATLPGSDLGVFWLSTDPADFANFPLVCTVDEFRVSLFPSLQPFAGLPFPGFADLTTCFAANDVDGSTCSSCGGRPTKSTRTASPSRTTKA